MDAEHQVSFCCCNCWFVYLFSYFLVVWLGGYLLVWLVVHPSEILVLLLASRVGIHRRHGHQATCVGALWSAQSGRASAAWACSRRGRPSAQPGLLLALYFFYFILRLLKIFFFEWWPRQLSKFFVLLLLVIRSVSFFFFNWKNLVRAAGAVHRYDLPWNSKSTVRHLRHHRPYALERCQETWCSASTSARFASMTSLFNPFKQTNTSKKKIEERNH